MVYGKQCLVKQSLFVPWWGDAERTEVTATLHQPTIRGSGSGLEGAWSPKLRLADCQQRVCSWGEMWGSQLAALQGLSPCTGSPQLPWQTGAVVTHSGTLLPPPQLPMAGVSPLTEAEEGFWWLPLLQEVLCLSPLTMCQLKPPHLHSCSLHCQPTSCFPPFGGKLDPQTRHKEGDRHLCHIQ